MAVWVALCLCTLSFPISALLCGTGSDYCGLCGLGSLQADFQLGSDTESYWQETEAWVILNNLSRTTHLGQREVEIALFSLQSHSSMLSLLRMVL